MKTIVVSGAHSGIGKTHAAEKLLRILEGWSALKVTVSRASKCPRHANACGVCSSLNGDFDLVTDSPVISQKGTDTARLKKAGAKNVAWLRATPKGLKTGLKHAMAKLRGSDGVVIEGTSVIKHIKPDLLVYVGDNSKDLRPIAKEAQRKADLALKM